MTLRHEYVFSHWVEMHKAYCHAKGIHFNKMFLYLLCCGHTDETQTEHNLNQGINIRTEISEYYN